MKHISDYIDDYGLITHWGLFNNGLVSYRYLDGGDAANRWGLYGVAAHINNGFTGEAGLLLDPTEVKASFNSGYEKFKTPTGQLMRHPDPNQWWSNPQYFSRDQETALVVALGLNDNYYELWQLFRLRLNRFFLYQNFGFNRVDIDGKKKLISGDVPNPEHVGYYIRGLNWWFLYPLLLVADLFQLINSIIIVIKSYMDADDTSNDLNHICSLILSKRRLPTPISWLARKLYTKFRLNAGVDKDNRLEGYGPLTALKHYFRGNDNPPIDLLFEPTLYKELK